MSSTQTPLERISSRVWRNGDPDNPSTPRPLLSLAEFFDGNKVVGSIGCNLSGQPEPHVLCEALQSVARRSEVSDIRVVITAFDDPDWPFSDTVYIITTATPAEVASWFSEDLAPDDTWDGFPSDQAFEPCAVPAGYRAIACWWD